METKQKIKGGEPSIKKRKVEILKKGDIMSLFKKHASNKEPFYHHEWKKYPSAAREFEDIEDYCISEDVEDGYDIVMLKKGMTTTLEGESDMSALYDIKHSCHLLLKESPSPCIMDKDIEACNVWGLDCYTRKMLYDCLDYCIELFQDEIPGTTNEKKKDYFVQEKILPKLNALGNEGWNLFKAIQEIEMECEKDGDVICQITARKLLKCMYCIEEKSSNPDKYDKDPEVGTFEIENFRAHSKGLGITCKKKGGLPKGTFICEYLGEIYPPWLWFEKQDILKQSDIYTSIPDIFNIQLERPDGDALGYGVLYVDAARKSNFASRLCHSCNPNCRAVPTCAEGKISNCLFAIKDIAEGEELTWDYSCITESEKEYKSAICLCSSPQCRGSFLYYAHSSTFHDIIETDHGIKKRHAILLRSAMEDMAEEDYRRLERNGIKSYMLQMGEKEEVQVPKWLVKWTSLILEFIEQEYKMLPDVLLKKSVKLKNKQVKKIYDEEAADIEASGIKANRIQNLIITIDKIKYILRKQDSHQPPIIPLNEEETIRHLWTDEDSIAAKASAAFNKHYQKQKKIMKTFTKGKEREGGQIEEETDAEKIMKFQKTLEPKTAEEARKGLMKMAETLRDMSPEHATLHDLLHLFSQTEHFFKVNKYSAVTSSPLKFSGDDLKKLECKSTRKNKRGRAKREQHPKIPPEYKKTYTADFIWGQMINWFKHSVINPATSLSNDKRGLIDLPSIDCCYSEPALNGTYLNSQRLELIETLAKNEDKSWKSGGVWKFKSSDKKVYGNPLLDAAMKIESASDHKIKKMIEYLKTAFND